MEPTINYLAVVLGAVASMVVGFLWYSKLLFGPTWASLMGHTDESLKEEQKKLGKLYGVSFLLALITSYLLAHVIDLSVFFYQSSPVQAGLTSALFMWLGFVMPVQFTTEMFGPKRWKVFGINTAYQLVWLLVAGLIIGLLG
jgi:hypothetical protein